MSDKPKEKIVLDLRLPKTKSKRLSSDLADLRQHLEKVIPYWSKMKPDQRAVLRAKCPVIDEFLKLAEEFYGNNL